MCCWWSCTTPSDASELFTRSATFTATSSQATLWWSDRRWTQAREKYIWLTLACVRSIQRRIQLNTSHSKTTREWLGRQSSAASIHIVVLKALGETIWSLGCIWSFTLSKNYLGKATQLKACPASAQKLRLNRLLLIGSGSWRKLPISASLSERSQNCQNA